MLWEWTLACGVGTLEFQKLQFNELIGKALKSFLLAMVVNFFMIYNKANKKILNWVRVWRVLQIINQLNDFYASDENIRGKIYEFLGEKFELVFNVKTVLKFLIFLNIFSSIDWV